MCRNVCFLGICAATLLTWISTAEGAETNVDWVGRVNVTATGDTLRKTGGCNNCADAGAVSRRVIGPAGGYVEFSPGETTTLWLAGLSHDGTGTAFRDVEFAFRFKGTGAAEVVENGVYQNGGDTAYSPGDRFRIAVANGRVRYFKNGRLLLESRRIPRYPLVLDAALGSAGASIRHATINVFNPGDEEKGEGSTVELLDSAP